MLVFGIDPGSTVTGYGVVQLSRGRMRYVDGGCIRTRSASPISERLVAIHGGLVEAIARHGPDSVAIEAIFKGKSAESALRLGQARGVALLAAAQAGFEPVPYNPSTVKRSIGAHGKADKAGVAKMVQMLLGVELDVPSDVTDALAIAMTHCAYARRPVVGR